MNTNLKDYVKVYSMIDEDLCATTVTQLDSTDGWMQNTFYSPKTDDQVILSGHQELDVLDAAKHADISTRTQLMDLVWNVLHRYIVEDLDLPWWNSWNGYTELRFNRYQENRTMARHCDHIHSIFSGQTRGIPILSVIGLLNDDFKGGEFVMFDDQMIHLRQGDFLVFPSNFLYPHTVRPVIQGTRYSFVSWVW
jgi:hypothetical protein